MKRLLFVFLLCLTAYGQRTPRVVDSVASLVALTPSAAVPDVVVVSTNSNTRIQFRYYPTASDSTNATSPYVYATSTGTGRWKEVRLTGDLTGVTIDGSAISSTGKLDITNGTPVIAGVTIGTNTLAHLEIGGLFPLPADATNYWAAGDSQTYGGYSTTHSYTDGSARLFAAFRWPNILATDYGLNLTNRAVSGSRIAYTAGAPDTTLAQLNVIGVASSGIVTVASGYNDANTSDSYGNAARQRELFQRAGGAVITRVLATDYSNAQGKRPDGTANASWVTAGSVTDGGNAGKAPFPVVDPATNTVQILTLTGTQTLAFAATNAVVWLETSSGGGVVQLVQGTNLIDTVSLSAGSTYNLPSVLTARGLSGTFTVTNVSGSNRILAAGSLGTPAASLSRTVVLCAPLRIGASGYSDQRASIMGNAYRAAAQDWAPYRVYFADANSRMLAAMIPSDDTSHPDPSGQKQIALAVVNSGRAPVNTSDSAPAMRYTDGGFEVHGAQNSESAYVQSAGMFVNVISTNVYVDSYNPATGLYGAGILRMKNLNLPSGGLQVQGGYSGIGELATGNYASLAHQGGVLYLASQTNSGSALTALPAVLQTKGARFEGFIMVEGGPDSLADYPTNSTVLVMSEAAGTVYIQALTSSGTVQTNEPLVFRSKRSVFEGPAFVTGVASSIADYPTNTSLRFQRSGTVSYIDSGTYNGTTDADSDLQIRALSVRIPNNNGALKIGNNSGFAYAAVEGAQNALSFIDLNTGTTNRYRVQKVGNTESGSNAGSDFAVEYFSDAGVSQGYMIYGYRASGKVALKSASVDETLELGHATANTLSATNGTLYIEDKPVLAYTGTPTTGQIAVHTNGAWTVMTPGSSGGIGGSTGSTDNRVLRADGTGGSTVQNSAISVSDETVYSSQYYVQAAAAGAQSNNHLVLSPKGTGAFIVGPAPDGSSTGGNNRGTYAVDLQPSRDYNGAVASGSTSVAIGGRNTASATYSVAIGYNNWSAAQGAVAVGEGTTASGVDSFTTGNTTTAAGAYSQAHGFYAQAPNRGQWSMSGGNSGVSGGSQAVILTGYRSTTATTQVTLATDGSSGTMALPNNSAWTFIATVTGITSAAGNVYSYTLTGIIRRGANAADTTMPAAVTQVVLFESNAAADATAVADTSGGALAIKVTPFDTASTKWSTSVFLNQLSF